MGKSKFKNLLSGALELVSIVNLCLLKLDLNFNCFCLELRFKLDEDSHRKKF